MVKDAPNIAPPGEDPRLERVGTYWHYEIFKVLPGFESSINLADFNNAVEIPERLAQGWRLVRADLNHALFIKPTPDGKVKGYEDLVQSTMNSFTPDGATDVAHQRQVYYLTETDKEIARDFLKFVSKLHIARHTPEGQERHARALRDEIDQTSDLIHMKRKFDTYFGHSQFWSNEELEKERKHKVDYTFNGHHKKMAKNV